MFGNKIYKHFFFELSKYFFIVLFTFTAIVWTVQAVNFLDLIVEDGHAISIYLNYSLLNVPKILTKFIPLSFLLALLFTISKLESENELLILWTSGLNKIKVINFFIKVSILVTFMQFILAGFINPNILNHSRSLIRDSNLDFLSSMVKTNQFNDAVEGLTIFVGKKNSSGVMENIFIRDDSEILSNLENSKNSNNLTIFAKKGRMSNKNTNSIILEEGIIHSEDKSKKINAIKFKKTELVFDKLKTKSTTYPKIQETGSTILFRCYFDQISKVDLLNCPRDKSRIEVLSELNRRFGMPLYIPLVSLLISFLLLSRREKKFQGLYKYFYFGLAFFALVMAEILVRYSGKDLVYTLIYYIVPISLIPLVYIELIRKFYYENLKV
jgi:lipopolysaccharide export system permease protein